MAGNQPNTDAHSTAYHQGSASSPGNDGKVVSKAERSSNAQTRVQRYMEDDGDRPIYSRHESGNEQSPVIAEVDTLFPSAGAGQAREQPRPASTHKEEAVRAIGDQFSNESHERREILQLDSTPPSPSSSHA